MEARLAKVHYSPQDYWKGLAAIKKVAQKFLKNKPKKLVRQALWQNYWPAPKCVPRPKFDVYLFNAVHEADLPFFLPYDTLGKGCGHKTIKYALTVVDVASLFKEAEALTSKNSDEVAKAFMKIYRRGALEWPVLQVDPEKIENLWGLSFFRF